VLLGRAYVCREPKQFKRPPCTEAGCCSDTCSKHSLYDSVIGTHNFTGPTTTMIFPMMGLMRAQVIIIKCTTVLWSPKEIRNFYFTENLA